MEKLLVVITFMTYMITANGVSDEELRAKSKKKIYRKLSKL